MSDPRTRDHVAKLIRGLYVIVDPEACGGRRPLEVARLAMEGGARIIQWRDKRTPPERQVEDVRALVALCRELGALAVANDYPGVALAAGAGAVHVGPDDIAPADARAIVGERCLVGVSTNSGAEARRAVAEGADYVAIGAIFPTASKETTRPADLDRIREVRAAVSVPVVAIGGINASNIDAVIDAGADAAAVISAVCGAADPREAARELASRFERR
jgi:thiamine-phosphate diphosphorylase